MEEEAITALPETVIYDIPFDKIKREHQMIEKWKRGDTYIETSPRYSREIKWLDECVNGDSGITGYEDYSVNLCKSCHIRRFEGLQECYDKSVNAIYGAIDEFNKKTDDEWTKYKAESSIKDVNISKKDFSNLMKENGIEKERKQFLTYVIQRHYSLVKPNVSMEDCHECFVRGLDSHR